MPIHQRNHGRAPGCGKPLPPGALAGGIAFCPYCQGTLSSEADVTGEYVYKLPTMDLAERIARWWEVFEGDADLYVKYHEKDVRFREMAAREGSAKTRQLRGLLAYPLAHILKDTASGKTPARAFADCLSA